MILQRQHFDLGGKAVLERFVFRPPMEVNGNMEGEACFILPVQGKIDAFNALDRFQITNGEGLLMSCGHYLNRWSTVKEGEDVETFIVRLYPEVLQGIFLREMPELAQGLSAGQKTVQGKKVPSGELLAGFTESLRFYFTHPHLVTPELTTLKVKELLLLVLHADGSGATRSLLQSLFQQDAFEPKTVVDRHLFESLGLEQLARLCNLSLSSFKRKFRGLSGGESPGAYITRKRLERAKLLLATGDSVGDVALASGYEDQGHFSKLFRKTYGLTPTAYRRQLKE